MVAEVLEWEEGGSAPTLVEIEKVVLKLRRRVAQRVAEALERMAGVSLSDSTAWRLTQKWGEKFAQRQEAERKVANALPQGVEGSAWRGRMGKRMGVALDGGMVHIRGEGWKEVQVGTPFEVEPRQGVDRETGARVEVGGAVRQSYVAHLGGPQGLGQKVGAEAQRRGWEESADTEGVGDGAAWVWNLAADSFYDSIQVVDWYHAQEHLVGAARLVGGEGTEAAQGGLKRQETVRYQGHALRIAQEWEQEAHRRPHQAEGLWGEAGDFRNNHRRMNYLERRGEGWPIGSGRVESGVKPFRARFTGAGMRWSRIGAERLLAVRAALMSRRFDRLWPESYTPP